MHRKYDNRYTISINVERSVYDRITRLLPWGVYISDEINEFLKQRLQDLEKDKMRNVVNNGPIRFQGDANFNNSAAVEQNTQHSLDIYGSKKDLVTHVRKITDSQSAWNLKRNAQLVCDLAKTRAKDLQRENK